MAVGTRWLRHAFSTVQLVVWHPGIKVATLEVGGPTAGVIQAV